LVGAGAPDLDKGEVDEVVPGRRGHDQSERALMVVDG
jgi:hypothetical protein